MIKNISNQRTNHNDWDIAIKKIINSNELIWKDKDKKGRYRERDMRPELKNVELTMPKQAHLEGDVSVVLNSLISSNGQSIKPIHIQHWLSESLGENLEIENIQRSELILKSAKI